jgi:hypothetical protein
MVTDEGTLEYIYSKCLGLIKEYLDEKTSGPIHMHQPGESQVNLNLILEVSNALKVLGEGVNANIPVVEGEEEPEP